MPDEPERWLSDVRGRPVAAADGRRLGRVVDLALAADGDRRAVGDVRFRAGRGPLLSARGADVASLGPAVVTLRPGAPVGPAPDAAGALLVRDVLDAQVVDVAGRRLRRVSDVRLRETHAGPQVVGVDTGWRALLRRLGVRRAGPSAGRLIDWEDVQPAPAGRHAPAAPEHLAGLAPVGLSELVARLPPEHGATVLQSVTPGHAARALSLARPRLGGRMITALPAAHAGDILAAMPVDDAVAVLRHVEGGRSARLLARIPTRRAAELRRLLTLPPHTAGGLMSTDVRTAAEGEPVAAVRERVAADPPGLECLTTVFVLDAEGRYRTALTPLALLGAAAPRRIAPLAVDTPLESVIERFAVEDVLALPVLDRDERLVGAVAIDDVLEELLAERLPQHRRRYRRARIRERGAA